MRVWFNVLLLLILFTTILWSASFASALEANYKPVKIFMGVDTANEAKIKFAMSMANKVFQDRKLSQANPQVQILILGEAFKFLIDGVSPATKEAHKFKERGWNFKMIGCGRAVLTMQQYLRDGKATLLPNVELSDKSSNEWYSELVNDGWVEVKIPEEI